MWDVLIDRAFDTSFICSWKVYLHHLDPEAINIDILLNSSLKPVI